MARYMVSIAIGETRFRNLSNDSAVVLPVVHVFIAAHQPGVASHSTTGVVAEIVGIDGAQATSRATSVVYSALRKEQTRWYSLHVRGVRFAQSEGEVVSIIHEMLRDRLGTSVATRVVDSVTQMVDAFPASAAA